MKKFIHKLWKKKWIRITSYLFLTIFLTLSSVVISACYYFKIDSVRTLAAVVALSSKDVHPVSKSLLYKKLKSYQNEKELISKYKPSEVIVLDEFKIFRYKKNDNLNSYTAISIISKDEILRESGAGSCVWEYTFFDTLSEQDLINLRKKMTDYYERKRKNETP
ncbi:MAG: hypothetical protein HRT88_01335 [Lentisphaeraceae bacterium]|nr:hypothetical protein [Lentisphaeraceae bacterium]